MTTLEILLAVGAFFAVFAVVMTLINLRFYSPPPAAPIDPAPSAAPLVTICIPARNEQANLELCVRSALAQQSARVEVLVYDDHSTDDTPAILRRLVAQDPRVHAVPALPLPTGWNGKQFACHQMGRAATGDWCLFTDADVRFEPLCIARTLAAANLRDCDLISTVPRQLTGTLGESLIVPLIHFVLLSYLPMPRMRATRDPNASAGVGQFLFVRREAYLAAGGHQPFAASMHDGIKMPRALRLAGYRTDLFDATALVSCRMYQGFTATWRGFTKNAYEGLGSVPLLVFITVVHALASLLPTAYLLAAAVQAATSTPLGTTATGVGLAAFALGWTLAQRLLLALRFEQSILSALLHPLGIALLTAIQWRSYYLHLTGQRQWKGRGAPQPTAA